MTSDTEKCATVMPGWVDFSVRGFGEGIWSTQLTWVGGNWSSDDQVKVVVHSSENLYVVSVSTGFVGIGKMIITCVAV